MTSSSLALLYLWQLRTLYIGDFESTTLTQGAASILSCVDGEIEIWTKDREDSTKTRLALIPAGMTFSVETFGQNIVSCYLDPVGSDFSLCQAVMTSEKDGIFFNSKNEDSQIKAFQKIYEEQLGPDETYQVLVDSVFPDAETVGLMHPVDERIQKVIVNIQMDTASNHSNKYLAEQVGLSDVHLRRLFKNTTGIPIRRYRLWHRLFITATIMAKGRTLTDAALEAGFSDSSHFNHVFKSMLGVKPSSVLNRSSNVRIFVGTA